MKNISLNESDLSRIKTEGYTPYGLYIIMTKKKFKELQELREIRK